MSHLSALLNVMESIEIDKELGKEIFKNYVKEYIQLTYDKENALNEDDFEVMKEIAISLGLEPNEFEEVMEVNDQDDEYDKYDAQVDNVVNATPGSTEFSSYLNRWVSPNAPDANYLF